ncbi:alpha/beta hydrolase [Mangrovimonas sp. DI 80]|uniref:alpha/beta hydrolase n=1 Tax=Mangrovimonas sp. DI 80 TaxID=1779330 RepID=UPI00097846C6|nr:alpha/beta hydrolase-fold protein [Mangrovimonas sp. DI 80]OMP31092.1 esterase [Mangrovimonas sp. DI 80]
MKYFGIFLIIFAFTTQGFSQIDLLHHDTQPSEMAVTVPFEIGDRVTMYSSVLDEDRVINVYLPNSYSKATHKDYPVIYLLDGARDEDFIHISGLVQFASFLWIDMVPESIVVGIANIDRKRDFTFPPSVADHSQNFPTAGGSEKFINFIEMELQPYIEKSYRTTRTKTIIGQSLGGLLATEILFTKPHLFNNYLIVSPSLWWDEEAILKKQPAIIHANYKVAKNIFIAVGGQEDDVMKREAKALYTLLQGSENSAITTNFELFEEQNHADILHLAAYKGLQTIFKKEE